jgi:hypothetical protein
MVAIPTALTAVAGAKNSAAAFNAGVRDPINFALDNYPRCRAYDAAGVAAANNTETLLTLGGETYDNDTMHSTVTNSSRIVFTTAGTYQVYINVQWPAGTFTGSNIHCRLNAAGNVAGGTQIRNWIFSTSRMPQQLFTRAFAAGDYIEFWVLQITGGALTTTAGSTPPLWRRDGSGLASGQQSERLAGQAGHQQFHPLHRRRRRLVGR